MPTRPYRISVLDSFSLSTIAFEQSIFIQHWEVNEAGVFQMPLLLKAVNVSGHCIATSCIQVIEI